MDLHPQVGVPAQPLDRGAGRLDGAAAMDPGVALDPPNLSFGNAIAGEVAVYRELMKSPEAREAFAAFLEKRPPDFAKARRAG